VIEESYREWTETVTTPPQGPCFSAEDSFFLGAAIAKRFKLERFLGKFQAAFHVSLTTSASYGSTRETGGRATEVSDYVLNFLKRKDFEFEGFDLFGRSVSICKDIPIGDQLYNPEGKYMQIDPDSPFLYNEFFGPRWGDCLLFAAIIAGIETGSLRLLITNDLRSVALQKPPRVKVFSVGEPGGKARIVTATEWWVTILLQPFGHGITSILEEVPPASAGLGRSYQGYEYAKAAPPKNLLRKVL